MPALKRRRRGHVVRGALFRVRIEGEAESLAAGVFRKVASVLVREGGF